MTNNSITRPPPRGIPNFLFSSSLRLFFVRSTIITAVTSVAFVIYTKNIPGTVIFLVTLVHHLGSAFGPRWFPLLNWMDLLLMIGEFVYNIYLLSILMSNYHDQRWFPKRYVAGVFGVWVLTLSLGSLLFLKLLQLIDSRGVTFSKRVDIIQRRLRSQRKPTASAKESPFWKYPVAVLFGRKIWEKHLPGEALWIALFRGFLAFCVIAALAIYGFFAIIISPVSEMGLTPNAQFRSPKISITFNSSTPVVWNIVVVWRRRLNAAKALSDVVVVDPLWGVNATLEAETGVLGGPPCTHFTPDRPDLPETMRTSFYEVLVFHCPPRVPIPDSEKLSFHPLYYDRSNTRPNLIVSVNFTDLMSPGERPGVVSDMVDDSLQIYLGLTNQTQDVIATTRPTPLLPGLNLLGVASLIIRQRLKAPELSTLGLFDFYNTFMVADMTYTTLDPLTFDEQFGYNVTANTSTMRIACQDDPGEWTVVQDYRNHSVLEGFSQLGGLGAFLSALFVIWFGSSLMRIVYRTKPLSPFGILHNLDNQQVILDEECNKEYPRLRADLEELRKNPGLLSFVFDTMLDVALFDKAARDGREPSDSDNAKQGNPAHLVLRVLKPHDDDIQPLISAPSGPILSGGLIPGTPNSGVTLINEEV